MKLSVGMPPGPDSVELAKLAYDLGYDRFWLYDSAALYEDVWITLARVAEHTPINIGTAVLVPNLRHVMTTASAIATIERLAPGRLVCGWGTGATARWVLNQKAVSWNTMRRYLTQLDALLRGDVVEIDGRAMPDDPSSALGDASDRFAHRNCSPRSAPRAPRSRAS